MKTKSAKIQEHCWGGGLAIRNAFLSSTGEDLAEYRQAVFEAINGLDGWKCVRMEDLGARPRPIHEFDVAAVRTCDLFVGILGHRYCTIPSSYKRSYTEHEYDTAVSLNLPRLMFIAPDDFPQPAHLQEPEDYWKRQQAFRLRVQTDRLAGRFSTPANLANKVLQSIRNWEKTETPPPTWFDWLTGLLPYLRSFVEDFFKDFFALVSGPRRFVAERSAAATLTIGRALGFLAATTLIKWAIPDPFHFQTSVINDIATDITFVFAVLIVYWLVLFLAWRSVGGTATLPYYLPIHLYFSAISLLLFHAVLSTWLGVLHTSDQKLYGDIMHLFREGSALPFVLSAEFRQDAYKSPGIRFVAVAGIFGGSLIITWFIASWGAYRVLNGVSRLRSVIAAFVFLMVGVLAYGVLALLADEFLAAISIK